MFLICEVNIEHITACQIIQPFAQRIILGISRMHMIEHSIEPMLINLCRSRNVKHRLQQSDFFAYIAFTLCVFRIVARREGVDITHGLMLGVRLQLFQTPAFCAVDIFALDDIAIIERSQQEELHDELFHKASLFLFGA